MELIYSKFNKKIQFYNVIEYYVSYNKVKLISIDILYIFS
jgi:hypothetical protein